MPGARSKCRPDRTRSGPGRIPFHLIVFGAISACLLALLIPNQASAHAELETSSPAASAVVAGAPTAIVATFTEPLERSYSRLQLFDSRGAEITGTSLSAGADDDSMVLTVPAGLPNGTYSVLWRSLSNADGHSAQNYFAFTIGTNADIASVVVPNSAVSTAANTAPQWLQTVARASAYIGAAALIATWLVWSTVIRPSTGSQWRRAPALVRRARRYSWLAIAAACLGSVIALVVQAQTIETGSHLDKVIDTLGQTRYGRLWLVRTGLIAVQGVVLLACGWWFTRRRRAEGWLAIAVAAAIPVPFGLIAHASAQPSGRAVAIAADAVHLYAASVWIGGLFLLATVLLPWARTLEPAARHQVLLAAIPRFSVLALIALAAVGVTGAYAGWLQVGNLTALRTTDYGRALIIKLVLLVVVLAIAGFNLLVIERHLVRRMTSGMATLWSTRLSWTVASECLVVILVLGAVGQITSLQPARDQVTDRANQVEIAFTGPELPATLLLAPGIAGQNHFRIELAGDPLPTEAVALLRMTIPERPDMGTKEIQLSRVGGNAFEHHGSELSIAGTWDFTMILREPGRAQINLASTKTIGTTSPNVDVPAKPWRFTTTGGLTGLGLILAGIAGLVVGWRSGQGRMRKESSGLGAVAVVLGIILLVQARIDPALAGNHGRSGIDPGNVAMVERGEQVYATYCLSCHGANLRGDGPGAAGLNPPPADFSQPHTMVHSEADLVYWLRYGKQGTAMPAFGDTLSDEDMQAVLSYIEYRQARIGTAPVTPVVSGCTVTPRTMASVRSLAGSGQVTRDGSAPLAAAGPAVDAATATQLRTITDQLVACTNALDTMRRLALFSDANIADAFSTGLPPGFAEAALVPPTPLPADQQLTIAGVQGLVRLADGRIGATVTVQDPAGQLTIGAAGGSGQVRATIVFVQVGQQWLIDEIRPI